MTELPVNLPDRVLPPRPAPCVSCPYRRDVPSGVWSAEEYARLPAYDNPTWGQDRGVFCCHQQDGHLCAGWVAVHDMTESLGLRLAVLTGVIDADDLDEIIDYTTDVELFSSGAEACAHGLDEIYEPSIPARKMVDRLKRKLDKEVS